MQPRIAGPMLALVVFGSSAPQPEAPWAGEAAEFLRAAEAEPAERLLPHRVELVEHTLTDTGPVVSSWTYVTVDEGQNWGVPSTIIDWMAATWNGVGQDANVVRSSDLTLLSRVTPGGGGPAGRLLESHYHAGRAAVVDANPDGVQDGREDAAYGEATGPDIRRGGLRDLADNRFYNEIVLPYRFATMELNIGDRHELPMFSPYIRSGTAYAVAALVDGRTEIRGEDGVSRPAFVVRTRRAASPAEAEAVDFDVPAAEHVFYVSAEPPYFLGKVWTRFDEGEVEEFKTWTYLGHTTFDISPAHRLDELLEVRRRHTAAEPQELPWDPALGFD